MNLKTYWLLVLHRFGKLFLDHGMKGLSVFRGSLDLTGNEPVAPIDYCWSLLDRKIDKRFQVARTAKCF